jgi:dihydroflavonol-4-reductase
LSGTVLITGATGQVGHAIARRLADDGVESRALMRSPERARVLPSGVEPVFGDVTDAPSLRAALDGCTTVYHAAGIPEQWRRDAGEFTRVNVEGTRNVVEAALAAGVERFVYTSTDDVLVQAPGATFDESVINPNPGQTPYQRSKQEADRIVTAALDRGLPAVFLHPAGLYGPAPFLVKGLNDLLLELAKRKTPALLPGGMGVAYSDDVADGHLRAAAQAPVGARYLLAESFQSLTDIARAVAANEPRAKVPRFLERGARPSGERARTELGWSPTPFAAGVERTLAHFHEQGWI